MLFTISDPNSVVIRAQLMGDLDKLDLAVPARVLRPGAEADTAATASPVKFKEPPDSGKDAKEAMAAKLSKPVYYEPSTPQHGLAVGERVRVELPRVGGSALRKVIPHSALMYDALGKTWVYTNPAPLTFLRARVTVDFIDNNVAVLLDGPATGTPIVTVGSTLLFGSELGK